jgi:tetratricopeptide (TPR) repeat protein
MAEISLLQYVALIEDRLIAGAADEASYHSQHILGRYPKYVAAFRLLGRALLLKGQFDEAEAAFRRVLAAAPSDLTAHLGLADLYDQRRRGDEAIWHAERALETDVHLAATTELLSALYRRYRGEERPRLGLTAVTLARTALQNRDYAQAIATLRESLERYPERIDQRLLLAEALWESGDHFGAAETATDVLDSLPDCLSANAVMARIWLENSRPSDARSYLNRLESLDPYAALQLVTGQPADADAFTIEVLDYQRSAQSDVTRIEPDWIQGLPADEAAFDSELATPDWTSGMLSAAAPVSNTPPPVLDEPASADDAPTLNVPVAAAAGVAGVAGLAAAADWWTVDQPPAETELPDFDTLTAPTVMLSEQPGEDADLYPPTMLLETPVNTAPLTGSTEPIADESMPDLDELFASFDPPSGSVQPFDESQPAPIAVPAGGATGPLPPLDPFAPEPMPPAEDAMAWLRESGVELVEDEAPAFSVDTGAEFPSGAPADQLDPMAWLNAYESPAAAGGAEPAPAASLGDEWQQEAWDPNALDLGPFADDASALAEEDDLAAPGVPGLKGLTARLNDPGITPPPVGAPVADDAVLDEWLSQFDAPAAAEPDAATPGWLNDLGAAMTDEPQATSEVPEGDAALEPAPELVDESAGWLNEFNPDNLRTDLEAAGAATGSDWLIEATAVPDPAAGAAEAGLPDWLVDAAPEASGAVAGVLAGDQSALDAMPGGEEFDWLNSLEQPDSLPAPEVDEAVLAAQADVPDWLNALEAEALATIDANQEGAPPEEAGSPEEFGAIAEVTAAGTILEAGELLPFDEATPVAEADDPETSWLQAGPSAVGLGAAAALGGVVALSAAQPQPAGDDRGETFAPVEDEADVAALDLPAEPAAEATAEPALEPEWLEAEPELESEPVAEWPVAEAAAVAAVMAEDSEPLPEPIAEDWGEPEAADLARIAPPSVGMDAIPPAAELPVAPDDWFADEALVAEAPVPADGSLAGGLRDDWFADAALAATADAEAEWQSELDAEATFPSVGTVAVLAEVTEPEEADAATEEALAEAESAFDVGDAALIGGAAAAVGVLALSGPDEAETAPGEATTLDELDADDDWLSAEWPDDAEAPVLQMDELDELPDIDIVEETAIAPAANAPDWLNAMVPGLDVDYEAGEDAPLESGFDEPSGALDSTLGARREYAWVIDLVEQEEHDTSPAEALVAVADEPRFVFRRLPAWYRREAANGSDDEFADWPGDDSSMQAFQN